MLLTCAGHLHPVNGCFLAGPYEPGLAGGDAMLHGQHGQLDSRVDVELEVDVLEMGVHSVAGEVELLGDTAVGHPPSHAGDDAQLGVGERRPPAVRSLLAVRTYLDHGIPGPGGGTSGGWVL